ncbi:MAG: hypothetical protein KF830_09480 [Planctomycetes bacterium]|nr:hypothetical protein [Planctomycetota bacterium]
MTTKPVDLAAKPVGSYVLPAPRRVAEVVVVPPPAGHASGGQGTGIRGVGDRFLAFAECQQQFLAEMRDRLQKLDAAIAEDSRARLKGALRGVLDVLEWCDAVQGDLATECRWAADGLEPVDVVELCGAVASEPGAHAGAIDVSGHAGRPWWGERCRLAAALRAGLTLVSERTGGCGLRVLEVTEDEAGHQLRIAGLGEPGDGVDAATVAAFRRAVEALGARVVPDQLGPGSAGFVLHLPSHRA